MQLRVFLELGLHMESIIHEQGHMHFFRPLSPKKQVGLTMLEFWPEKTMRARFKALCWGKEHNGGPWNPGQSRRK